MNKDEKKYIGEVENSPTEAAIRAHLLGREDLERVRKLMTQNQLAPRQIADFVSHYADHGDIHAAALKFNMRTGDAKRLLASFNIESIEQARAMRDRGLVADVLDAELKQELEERQEVKRRAEAAEARLEALEASKPAPAPRPEAELREEAQQKNKDDQIRDAMNRAEKFHNEEFRIPVTRELEFKQTVVYGVAVAQRRFGGTRKQIINEVRRLLPSIDVSLLR